MQLERLSVALRPRGGWEALDLGFQMARGWWRPVWGTWLAVYLPAAAILHVLFQETLWIAPLVLWWLKPVFDRFVLHVVSRAVFGAPPTVAEALRAWREILQPGLLAGLAWYPRLSLARSFNLPVWQLEKQTGAAARERWAALGRRMRGYAVWLTIVCLNFEALVLISLGLVVALLAPAGGQPGFEFSELFRGGGDGEARWDWFDSACYVAAVSLVEPLYVAAGFSLYLNRRAILEGWDIELSLRRLDERLRLPKAATLAGLVLALACLAGAPPPAFAADKSAKQEIAEVLRAPEFRQSRDQLGWRYRGERKKQDAAPSDFWANVGAFFAQISQALAWIAVGIGVVVLLVLARRYLLPLLDRAPDTYRPPDALFGLAVTPESLPDDVAGTAARLAREGRLREALSLLYRGALSVLVHRDHVPLAEGDTEGDCARAVRKALPRGGADYFGRLVAAWQRAAYAGRLPEAGEAQALASEWTPHFAPRAAEGAGE
ncbi:MAG TPA: DUF4129 domain-containing protein [Burkholderiales bacterium]|nr:DUF4129 domain-containing protein [Burkholderiales bacterium]